MGNYPALPKCLCGHAKRNHLQGVGLCIVASCNHPCCLHYQPARKP